MTPFIEPDWPESNPQEFTRVVLISTSSLDFGAKSNQTESESQEYDRARGKIDSILAYKKEVDVSTILDPVPSPENPTKLQAPKVLMDGAPGVGKTTLTLNACKDWAENRLFKQYDLVLLVPLRQASCREAKSIEDLLPGDNEALKAKVVQYIQEKCSETIAFIFDGYDELSYEQRHKSDSLFMKIFRGKKMTKCAVWITSRPYTSGELKKGPSIINKHIEVLGFNKEQIYSCIRKRINDDSSANNLISQLEEREDIASLCYIPLVCIIMIHVYKSLIEKSPNSQPSLPATMTKLVERFLLVMLTREVLVVENNTELDEDNFCDINNLPTTVTERLDVLNSLAYDCLIRDKFVFTYSELKSVYGEKLSKSTARHCCLGLLSSATSIGKNNEEHFQFVHLSIQEFLAARHVRLSETLKYDDQMDIFYQFIDNPRFGLFMLFFAGMVPLNKEILKFVFCLGFKKFGSIHEKNSRSGEKINFLMYYMNLIFETQQFEHYSSLYHCLPDKSELNLSNQRMTLFDCRILTHFLCSVNQNWESLDLSNCSLTLGSMRVMNNVLKNCYSDLRPSKISRVDLSYNDPDVINNLQLFPWLNSIKVLNFQMSRDYEQKFITSNLEFLCHIPKLCIKHDAGLCVSITTAKLTLCSVSLGEGLTAYLKGVKEVELKSVHCSTVNKIIYGNVLQALEVLIIKNVDVDLLISQHAAMMFSSTNLILRELTLSGVGLSSLGALPLLESLMCNTMIRVLDLSYNPGLSTGLQCDKIGSAIETLLVTNKTIEELIMVGRTLSDKLAQYLIPGIWKNTALKCLDISQNPLTIKSICNVIAASVNHDSGLSQLKIDDIVLKRNGLSQAWKLNNEAHTVGMEVFSVLSKLHDIVTLEHIPVSRVSVCSLEPYNRSATFFQALRNDKHINDLSFYDLTLDIRFGYAVESMLTFNKVLNHIEFHRCILPNSVLTHLYAGLSGNSALKTLSFTSAEDAYSIIHILHALQHNSSVKELDLSHNGSVLVRDGVSKLTASKFENLLKNNRVLAKINLLETYINDEIASSFARGLSINKGLQILNVSLSMLTSNGTKEILISSYENMLSKLDVHQLCSFKRNNECGWELLVSHEYHFWPHLQHLFLDRKQFSVVSFKINEYGLAAFQFERIFSVLANNAKFSLRFLDLSHHCLSSSSIEDIQNAKDIGIALKELLINCSCLEKLTLKQCELPRGTWNYAAKGLSEPSCSLKYLDVSQCGITTSEAVSIFKHLRTLHELNLADNERITYKDPNYTEQLCSAIKQALTSKLQRLNMKNSINNEIAIAIASPLTLKSNLQTIELSEKLLSFDVIQTFFTLMVQDENPVAHLTFTDVTFSNRQNAHDFWFDAIKMFANMKQDSREYYKLCKSSKLFCGLCTVQLYQHQRGIPFHNVTSIELDDVDHNAMSVLSQSVKESLLPKLTELTLKVMKDSCNKVALGQQLQEMLENCNSLYNLTLYGINTTLIENLSDGLVSAQFLKTVRLTMTDQDLETFIGNNCCYLAKLLKAMESSRSLMNMSVYKLPTIRRRSIHSKWYLALSQDESLPFYPTGDGIYPLLPWIICSVSSICNDQDLCSHTAKSVLLSCPNLKLHFICDVSLITRLFRCLSSNHTLQELDVSENKNMAQSCDTDMCEAIKVCLSTNISLKVLKFSGSLTNAVSLALITGLERNQTPRHLHFGAKSLKISTLSKLAVLLEVRSVSSLTITGVFTIHHYKNSYWHIKIVDPLLWSQLLSVLMMNSFSDTKLWSTLKKLMDIGCLYDGSPLLFDISCESMHFQLPINNSFLSTSQDNILPRSCDIKNFLMNVNTLKYLVLSGCNISDDGCEEIANGLAVTPQLTKLDLSANSISDSGMITLCRTLQTLPVLKELNMSFNQLSCSCEDLGPAIKTYLESSKIIKTLNFQSCNISDPICKLIGLAMNTNRSLNFLDMSDNKITSKGANILLDSLQYNNIIELNLSRNYIFTDGYDVGQTLQRILAANNHLASLSLNSGAINNGSLAGIVVGLNRNKTLQELTLDFSQCNLWMLRTLLVESNSNLDRINLSNLLSFIRTDSGWKVELRNSSTEEINVKEFIEGLLLANLKIVEVTTTNLTVPILNIHLQFQQMIGIITSLESCSILRKVCLLIDRNLQCSNEELGSALEQMIEKTSTIEDIELYGNVSDIIAARVVVGLKSKRHSSIKVLNIETSHLCVSSIAVLMEIFNETDLYRIRFNPHIQRISQIEMSKFYCMEMIKTHSNSANPWTIDSEPVVTVVCTYLDVPLTISLFSFLQKSSSYVTLLDLSRNKQVVNLGESINQALERMLICNTTINTLNFCNSVNNNMLKSIAKGMTQNQNVHTIIITISGISDDALGNLLLSLSHSPLTVKVVDHCIFFMRCISETILAKLENPVPSLCLKPQVNSSSAELQKIFGCLNTDSGSLKEFEFSFSARGLSDEMIVLDSDTINLCLTRIKTLQTLKMCNPVTMNVIRKLAADLKENNTLNQLALHPRTLNVGNIKLIFEAIQTSNITKLEFINEVLFTRDKRGAQWKLEIIKYDVLMVLPTAYKALNELLNTCGFEIATIIDKNVRNMILKFPGSNNQLTLLILRSMENGDYPVRKLDLIFSTDIDNPEECGNTIERMLKSCKSLKKLTVVNVRNDIIASHLIEGLTQNTSLAQLYVKDQYLQCNSIFVQNLLKMHLVNPSIHKICICDEISLQRKSQYDPWKERNSQSTLNETLCNSFSNIMMTTLGIESNTNYEKSDTSEDLSRDGSWKIMPKCGRNSMLSTFCLLNKIMCNTCSTSIGGLMLEYLRNLNFSNAHLNCKQLANLFEELQENTSVVSLDVSFSVYEMPHNQDLDMHHTLRGMLERNKTIKILNLTGIVDDEVAAVLANTIQNCSLKSLSINFTTKDYCFNRLEDLLHSFMDSKSLLHLELTKFCVIQRKETLMHIDLFTNTQCQFRQLPSNVELLQSWCILFLFYVLTKGYSISGLGVSVNKHLNDGLMKKVFQMFFDATVRGKFVFNAAENLVIALKELHLDITIQSFAILSTMIEPFKNLKELHLSHDANCCTIQKLALMYERLMSSNQTLELIRFNGYFNDTLANAVAEGLIHNGTLQILQFSANFLSVEALTHLLKTVCNSALTCIQISEGCCLKRFESKKPFDVEFTGDKALLCKLFCASVHVNSKDSSFLISPSPLCCEELDLTNDNLSSNTENDIDLFSLFSVTSEGFISKLVLTRNKIILDYSLLTSTSILEILKLDYCHINDHDCEHIAMGLTTNKCLKVLDLHHNDITSCGATLILSSVTKNNTLQYLDLSDNDLSPIKVSKITPTDVIRKRPDCKNILQTLKLGSCHPLFIDFSSALYAYTSLKVLSLAIKEEELFAKIIYLLKDSQTIEDLDISESSLETPTMGLAIKQLLKCSYSIKSLNMSECNIPDNVCMLFMEGLKENKYLEKLDLSGNKICRQGILSIFSVLEGNTCSLLELNLSSNWEYEKVSSIPHDQIESATILSRNRSLKTLIVSEFYRFSDWFGGKLFEGLQQNDVLRMLDISDNVVRPDAFNELLSMLSSNSSLSELNIRWVEFPACIDGLTEALLQYSSLEVIIVDPVIDQILKNHKDQLFSRGITIIKSVGGGYSQFVYYKE